MGRGSWRVFRSKKTGVAAMDNKIIRVVLADDHTMFRQGLAEMLSTDESIEIVGEAANGAEAVAAIEREKPDVMILDVEMPIMDAREVVDEVARLSFRPKIVVVTMFDHPHLVRDLLARGASAYLVKSATMEELISAVHTVAHNPREDNVTIAVPREVLDRIEHRDRHSLSDREMEVLLLAARGLSNQQAAALLRLSEATVKRHLANIYQKMNVNSRGEATRKALAEGWISSLDLTRER